MPPKKPNDLARHAVVRAKQRYDLDLSPSDVSHIIDDIQTRQSVYIKKQSNTRSWHRVSVKGLQLLVVYDKLRHTIVTFLPAEVDNELCQIDKQLELLPEL